MVVNATGVTSVAGGGDAFVSSVVSGVEYDQLGRPKKESALLRTKPL
jgi:hypothetical protein